MFEITLTVTGLLTFVVIALIFIERWRERCRWNNGVNPSTGLMWVFIGNGIGEARKYNDRMGNTLTIRFDVDVVSDDYNQCGGL